MRYHNPTCNNCLVCEKCLAAIDQKLLIFVFGSNLAGRHGKGAALEARRKYGAIYGRGIGIQESSYAIPTKNGALETLPLTTISMYVNDFKMFAFLHPETTFFVTRIGCGLAGYTEAQIAPLFHDFPGNCILPEGWREVPFKPLKNEPPKG